VFVIKLLGPTLQRLAAQALHAANTAVLPLGVKQQRVRAAEGLSRWVQDALQRPDVEVLAY